MFANHLTSLGPTLFWTITLMEFVLKTRANSSPSQRVTSSQRSSPKLFPTVSRPSTASMLPSRSFTTELSPSYFPRLPLRPPCCRFRSCSFTTELAPSYFPRFPLRPPCRRFMSLPSCSLPTEISPNYFPQFPSVHPVVASISLPPNGALWSYFPRFPLRPPSVSSLVLLPNGARPKLFPTVSLRPPCRRFCLAPSQRSSPQTISHGFPSVHPVVASVSLLPNEALPKLFPTVSRPSTASMLPSRSFQRSSPQAISHGFPSVHPVVASVLAPSQRSSPQAISHGFPSVHRVVASCRFRLAPSQRSSPQTISHSFPPSTLSSLPSRSLPTELSPSYFPRFPSTLSPLLPYCSPRGKVT